ncbi:MAG: GntR family transcriptional regulator [Bacillus sp. (in: firmicutes)]
MINKQSPIPIYHQLEELLKEMIDSDQWKAGEAIPSERELSETYGISRMTVRQALTNLVNEGLLYRKKGTGTFVNDRKVEQILQGLTSFSEDMTERGLKPSSDILSYGTVKASASVASKLGLELGSDVLQIERIRLADNEPMALETAYMPLHLTSGLTKETAKDSIYHYIEDALGLRIAEAHQELEAIAANERDAAYLQIEPGCPVLKITRITFLDNDKPFEYVKSLFRADRYRFYHQLKR